MCPAQQTSLTARWGKRSDYKCDRARPAPVAIGCQVLDREGPVGLESKTTFLFPDSCPSPTQSQACESIIALGGQLLANAKVETKLQPWGEMKTANVVHLPNLVERRSRGAVGSNGASPALLRWKPLYSQTPFSRLSRMAEFTSRGNPLTVRKRKNGGPPGRTVQCGS